MIPTMVLRLLKYGYNVFVEKAIIFRRKTTLFVESKYSTFLSPPKKRQKEFYIGQGTAGKIVSFEKVKPES
jgi:hypothetical protein